MYDYDATDIKRLFGLTSPTLKALIRAGHIQPTRLKVGYRYSFEDLLLLRTVGALRAARVPARKIHVALLALRSTLPDDVPMSRLPLAPMGARVAVRDQGRLREAGSNQYGLAFGTEGTGPSVHTMPERTLPAPATDEGEWHFERALDLEDSDPEEAKRAYQECLSANAAHTDARVNLGRLLHLAGMLSDAERIYRDAAEASAEVAFNLAVVLEDLEREPEAVGEYQHALALDPALPDAHFNLARLYERAGDPKASFRHLLAYRRLMGEAR